MSFQRALFEGLAPDGGLYMPNSLPTLERGEIDALEGLSYPEVAFRILSKYLGDELTEEVSLREASPRSRNASFTNF